MLAGRGMAPLGIREFGWSRGILEKNAVDTCYTDL